MLSSLILLNNNKPFLNQIMTCDEKWFCMTAANSQLSGWIKKKLQSTSQSQTCTKKRSCHCLVGCWLTGPQQLSESQWNHYIWEICSADWWDTQKSASPAASIGQEKGPSSSPQQCLNACHTAHASKVQCLGLWSFGSLTWSLANQLPLLKASWQSCRKNAFQEFVESWSSGFYGTGINKHICHLQKCVDCNGSYFG